MATLIAMLAIRKDGEAFLPVHLLPAVILKLKNPKVIANPNNLLVTSNKTGVINSVYMRDTFIPHLVAQLRRVPGQALIILDSASAHISKTVLAAFRAAGLKYAIIPGGLTMFIQAIDVALAALYRTEHHRLYMTFMENRKVLTAAQCRNAFADFAYRGLCAAEARIDIPGPLKDVGYLDPSQVKLRIPLEFVPPPVPQEAEGFVPKPKPKPKPKPVPRQLSITRFVT